MKSAIGFDVSEAVADTWFPPPVDAAGAAVNPVTDCDAAVFAGACADTEVPLAAWVDLRARADGLISSSADCGWVDCDDDDRAPEPLLDAAGATTGELRRELGALLVERAVPVDEPALEPPCAARDGPADDEPPEPESPEPPESAKAVGIEAIAAPTPNATAKPPTRPTQRA